MATLMKDSPANWSLTYWHREIFMTNATTAQAVEAPYQRALKTESRPGGPFGITPGWLREPATNRSGQTSCRSLKGRILLFREYPDPETELSSPRLAEAQSEKQERQYSDYARALSLDAGLSCLVALNRRRKWLRMRGRRHESM